MKKREIVKLKGWTALKGKEQISMSDVLLIQPKRFWIAMAFNVAIGVAILYNFGVYSMPFGVVIGGLASTIGYLARIKRNLVTDLHYLNWDLVNEALNEKNT